MSIDNTRTIEMYNNGGALEYINHKTIDPETDKWERLFKYVDAGLNGDRNKFIVEFGSGTGDLAKMLQDQSYDIVASDIVDDFLKEQQRMGINNVVKYNFLTDDFIKTFGKKADLIISWRNPHLNIEDVKKLFEVVYNGLNDDGLFIINFQNALVHPEAEIASDGTKYNYLILKDKQTQEKRFYAYYTKEDIDTFREGLFDIVEYHNEGGAEKLNWHVLTLKKK